MPTNSDVFKFKSPSPRAKGFNVATLYGNELKEGEISIEIEVEGNKFPKHIHPVGSGYPDLDGSLIPAQWKYTPDGSLRGEDNAEYILREPILFSEVPKAVDDLWKMFSDYGSVLAESNRTSVHVHLNVQKFHLNRLCAFMALYFSVEEILTEWCGEHRVGNLFCLRAKDAPAIVSRIKRMLQDEVNNSGFSDGMHYAGLNAQALQKFGSLEIRSLRGVNDPKTILEWVGALEHIYKLSEEFPDPRMICEGFSGGGPIEYFNMVLGPKAQVIRQQISYSDHELMEVLYDGIRLAQDLCYCRDWSLYEPVDVNPDPFNRSASDVSQSLSDLFEAHPALEEGDEDDDDEEEWDHIYGEEEEEEVL